MHFAEGGKMFISALQQLEQSVGRLVQQDAVDDILMCGGGFFMLEEITSDH